MKQVNLVPALASRIAMYNHYNGCLKH